MSSSHKNVDILPHACVRSCRLQRCITGQTRACRFVAVPRGEVASKALPRERDPTRRDEARQPRNHEGMSASGNEQPLDIGDDGNLSELFPTIGFDIAWSAASAGALAPRPVSSATSRAVAAALAARQALPVALGGLAIPDDAPLSRPSSAAPTPRAPQPLPELKTKWEVECGDRSR